jgi:phage terminase large subunit-like protein
MDFDLRLLPGYDPYLQADGYWFDEEEACRRIEFIEECCTHVEGALSGKQFVMQEWQRCSVANLFGWKRSDGSRRYREAFYYVPRKNGKSPLCAAIANCIFFLDGEAGMQGYIAAANADQANLLFRQCAGMINNEEELAKRARVLNGYRIITSKTDANSFLKVVSSKANTKHGGNTHLAIIDELHAQPNRDLIDVMSTSMASKNRRQPLLMTLTTADFARPSVCNEKLKFAKSVMANRGSPDEPGFDPSFLPVVYEATNKMDWTSEETWKIANPNFDISVSKEYLERECRKAQEEPSYENTFKRLHLNIITEQAERWLRVEDFDACDGEIQPPNGRHAVSGLDLASTTDLAAMVSIYEDGEFFDVFPHFWMPEDCAHEREKKDNVPYLAWARSGLITLTPGNVIDYDFIFEFIVRRRLEFGIDVIGFDPWNATGIAARLADEGINMIEFRQGYKSMNEPSKELERLLRAGRFRHGGNPILRWQVGAVAIERDPADNIKPTKAKSNSRIDGIVSWVMSLGMHMAGHGGSQKSIYEERGPIEL